MALHDPRCATAMQSQSPCRTTTAVLPDNQLALVEWSQLAGKERKSSTCDCRPGPGSALRVGRALHSHTNRLMSLRRHEWILYAATPDDQIIRKPTAI